MKFGLSEEQYQFIVKQVIEPLEQHNARVWCYGSRARGTHGPFSDLDLMAESSSDLSSLIYKLQENLSNSNFPYKVDLVQYSNFAESYKPGYQQDKVPFVGT